MKLTYNTFSNLLKNILHIVDQNSEFRGPSKNIPDLNKLNAYPPSISQVCQYH
jgi:hypothetical protein